MEYLKITRVEFGISFNSIHIPAAMVPKKYTL